MHSSAGNTTSLGKASARSLGPLLLAWLLSGDMAHAVCLGSSDPEVRELETLVFRDPAKVVPVAQARIESLRSASSDPRRIAGLQGALAHAFSALELDRDARQTAAAGLALVPRVSDPAHLTLLAALAENIYDSAGLADAVARIEAARAAVVSGSAADICLTITLGRLQHRQDRDDLAVLTLTRAYRSSVSSKLVDQRVRAAAALANVVANLGDHAQALALNQEVIDWDVRHGAWLDLSVTRYLRGEIHKGMRDYPAAIRELAEARRLSVQLEDRQGVAFADLRLCQSNIEQHQWRQARKQCTSALETFVESQSVDVIEEARALLAQTDLAEGRAREGLVVLNDVIARAEHDLPPRRIAMLYQLRAQAHAALGQHQAAYADMDEFVRRYMKVNDAERTEQSAGLRARFEIDRQVERSESLQRELELARERAQRQQEQLRWTVIAAAAAAIVIVLLSYILIANLRHRRALSRLANNDMLTGLPNRRRTAELATHALADATSCHETLTVGIVDLDYFKIINDRCGHAVGDFVLKEFARIGRQSLRESDVLGRWGGEEFLIVMPGTTLDTALAVLERLRLAVLAIPLPSSAGDLRISFSAGLATNELGLKTLDEVVAQADAALYEAKNDGRDLVRIAQQNFQMASTGVRRALRGLGRGDVRREL